MYIYSILLLFFLISFLPSNQLSRYIGNIIKSNLINSNQVYLST